MEKKTYSIIIWLSFFFFIILLLVHWRYGHLYLDGGYYVSAGNGVVQGKLPYRDFFFPQGPIYPYFYGVIELITGSSVQSARFISLILSILIFFILVRMLLKHGSYDAASIGAILLSFNSFLAYNLVVEKLNALAGLLLLSGAYFFLKKPYRKNETFALLFFALAVITRYTLLPAGLIVGVWLIWKYRDRYLIIPVSVSLLLVFSISAVFLIKCPEPFLYGIIGVHISAAPGSSYHFGLLTKLGALSQLIEQIPLIIILTLIPGIIISERSIRARLLPNIRENVLWVALIFVTFAHLSANWFHASYQIVILPLWILLLSLVWNRLLVFSGLNFMKKSIIVTLIVGSILTVFAQGRSFMWREKGAIASPFLENVSEVINSLTSPDSIILTDQPLIAFQSDRRLVHGFEGAPFTYTPFWNTTHCQKFSTVNNEMLKQIISSKKPDLLVLTEKSFQIASPGFVVLTKKQTKPIWDIIKSNYKQVKSIEQFGGTADQLIFYLQR